MAIIPLVQRLMGCFRGATGGATGVGRAWTTSNLGALSRFGVYAGMLSLQAWREMVFFSRPTELYMIQQQFFALV